MSKNELAREYRVTSKPAKAPAQPKETRGEKAHRLAVARVVKAARKFAAYWSTYPAAARPRAADDVIWEVNEHDNVVRQRGAERRAATRKAKR